MIPGIDFGEMLTAFLEAFDSDDLEEMVRIRLDQKLRAIVAPGPDKHRIFKLLEWAEQRGLMVELIRAAYLERPNNPKIREIYQKFGLAVAVAVQHAGGVVPNAPTSATAPALEATVKPRLKRGQLEDGVSWRHPVFADRSKLQRCLYGSGSFVITARHQQCPPWRGPWRHLSRRPTGAL